MVRRIIPVASGKGGVGKTTFATNFALALSRVAPTALIDLDAGTSSIRNTVDTPIERDLYHFFRRDEPLSRCITHLDANLDPDGLFRDFGLIAAPRHAVEEITALPVASRHRLMHAINELPVSYVVLDLRAGLGPDVLDFLPISNCGILVFTPQHPAAVLAAAELVRSLLFRKLRVVFAPDGPLAAAGEDRRRIATVNILLDRVEDAYDEELPNLDAFLVDLAHAFGSTPLVRALAEVVRGFPTYFVLNLFDGVQSSFDMAVKPFVASLHEQISASLSVHNLGWLIASDEVHRSNCARRPFALRSDVPRRHARPDAVAAELDRLAESVGLPSAAPARSKHHRRDFLVDIDPQQALDEQLDVLNAMYSSTGTRHVRDNLAYIVRRVLHLVRAMPPERFGQQRLLTPTELVDSLLRWGGRAG